MQIFNFFYTYANFLPTIFNLSPNFIPKSPEITAQWKNTGGKFQFC